MANRIKEMKEVDSNPNTSSLTMAGVAFYFSVVCVSRNHLWHGHYGNVSTLHYIIVEVKLHLLSNLKSKIAFAIQFNRHSSENINLCLVIKNWSTQQLKLSYLQSYHENVLRFFLHQLFDMDGKQCKFYWIIF